jgi:hypothetical protein
MAKAQAAETINLGELIKRLGVNQPTWVKHPEWREWLNTQDGVVFEARKSSIPASLVDGLREQFDIQPVQKRARRANGTGASVNTDDIDGKSVQELLTLREEADNKVSKVKADLADAQADVKAINKAIKQAQANADRRIAEAEAAVEKARADRETLLSLTTGDDD